MKKDIKEARKNKININKEANALNLGQFQIHYMYIYFLGKRELATRHGYPFVRLAKLSRKTTRHPSDEINLNQVRVAITWQYET